MAMRSTPASPRTRFSLVDRGFVAAIAHVRGGTDKGWRWYEEGKLARKPNTFSDFLAVARHLIAEGYTGAGRIVAQGGSAGGLLMGVVANEAPELFAGIVADVPFVDALATMMDETLPLTPPEWLEWGDPIRDPAGLRDHPRLQPLRQRRPASLSADPGARRADRPARRLLGAGQMGAAAPGDDDGRRSDPAAYRHGRRPWRQARPVRPARGSRPQRRLRPRLRRGRACAPGALSGRPPGGGGAGAVPGRLATSACAMTRSC